MRNVGLCPTANGFLTGLDGSQERGLCKLPSHVREPLDVGQNSTSCVRCPSANCSAAENRHSWHAVILMT